MTFSELMHKTFSVLKDFWNLELFNNGEAVIHVGQLFVALMVCIVGLFISKRVSIQVGRRLKKVPKLNENLGQSIQQTLFYVLAIFTVMFSLTLAGIPITVFTVMGGALAIGVGFGAQNTFNNVLSGVIILFEKPVRLGDIVEMNNMEGQVQEIGHRVIRVRRVDGVDLLVPSSYFLDKPVVNWTLYDSAVRGEIRIGVAYGSNTELVRAILESVVDKHIRVKNRPAPEILFSDFGENALMFTLLFWIHVKSPLDRRRIESDIRYAIDEAFRREGITIAFPQRDVHLSLDSPVKITQ